MSSRSSRASSSRSSREWPGPPPRRELPAGHHPPDPLRAEHRQDHEGDGARGGVAPAPRAGPDPGVAAVRRPHAPADDRDRVGQLYTEEAVDLVVMVYNRFHSALTQEVQAVEVLPIPESALEGDEEDEGRIQGAYLEEPDRAEILAHLLPTYVETTIYRALLE